MAKLVRDVHLGDHSISLKESDDGNLIARLTSIENGGLLEIEKLDDNSLRIRDLDLGSAVVLTEHLAHMLTLVNADQSVIDHINNVNEVK